jgi:hypothetical protein
MIELDMTIIIVRLKVSRGMNIKNINIMEIILTLIDYGSDYLKIVYNIKKVFLRSL